MTEPRWLGWRLRHSEQLEKVTNLDNSGFVTLDFFPQDPNEKTTINMNISLNEFVKIASSIDVGRDIAYGEDSLDIWNIWSNAIMPNTVNCEDVANCIETSDAVQTAITNEYQSTVNDYLEQSGAVNPDTTSNSTTIETRSPEYSSQPVAPSPVDCDKDKLWSGIREIVARIDDNGRDLLQDLTLINDRAQQIQGLIDLVPLLGDIIADVAEFFTEAVPDLLNGYDAFSSEAEIDNLACELFDIVCAECRYPTLEEVLQVYSSKSIAGLATNPQLLNYSQVWNAVRQVPSLNGSLVYHSVNTWQLITLYFNSKFSRTRGKNSLNIWASIGEDLPTDNWVVLCGGCNPQVCDENNFVVSQSGFNTYSELDNRGYGIYATGIGWGDEKRSVTDSRYITIEKTIVSSSVSSATMVYDCSSAVNGVGESVRIELMLNGSVVHTIGGSSGAGLDLTMSGSYNGNIDNVRIIFAMNSGKSATVKEFNLCD